MATFTGTSGDDIITPSFVSAGVITSGGSRPGNGADTIFGGAGNDTIDSSGGADLVVGGLGNDTAFLGAGNDRFVWDPGNGSDTVEGQAGTDTFELNGANIGEIMEISANGARTRLTRDVGNVTIDMDGMERIEIDAVGGADRVTVRNLAGTAVTSVAVDLAAIPGGSSGDAQADIVQVDGTGGNDGINVASQGSLVTVGGLKAQVTVAGAEAALDNLVVMAGAGNDTINASGLAAGQIGLTVDGGAGTDAARLNGSDGAGTFDVFGSAGQAVLARDGAVVMSLVDVERVDHSALGGADQITVGDLAGTAVRDVVVDLASTAGGKSGDGQADNVTVVGTNGIDNIVVSGNKGSVVVDGLTARTALQRAEAADQLVIAAGAGDDAVNASALSTSLALNILGGLGNDVLTGSDGNDIVFGGDGNDVAFLGAGNDRFVWQPGDDSDLVEGQAGFDTLDFNGSSASENITISANGARAQLFRDLAGVTMDLDGVERIELDVFTGLDQVNVGDLAGTAVREVAVGLAAATGGGDALVDEVRVNGTGGNDSINVGGSGGNALVQGLVASTSVQGGEAVDKLVIAGGGGNDTINASAYSGNMQLTILGELGDDVITGGAGDDVVVGGDGNDMARLGAGNDRFVWNPGDDNDSVDGQAGFDTLDFNASNAGETVQISANGAGATLFRNVANVTMDLASIERVELDALGGADTILVGDLAGSAVSGVAVDLAGVSGGSTGDGQADSVIVDATANDDVVFVSAQGAQVRVDGLTAQVTIDRSEAAFDRLTVRAGNGNDVVDAGGLPAGLIQLTLEGGAGNDVLIGSDGNDVLLGGAGDDVLLGGLGVDIIDGGGGDDVIIQSLVGGEVTVLSFELGHDRIQLEGVKAADLGRANLSAGMRQVGADLHLDFGATGLGDGQLVLKGIGLADIGGAADLFG
jgi:Ca2+-binding RTX toxin-like protein